MNLQSDKDLKIYNTFGISVKADEFLEFESVEELKSALKSIEGKELLILGGGSNILFTQDFKGAVLKNNLRGIQLIDETENHVFIEAAAGENWHQLVLETLQNNWYGLENLSYIPGNVGASPMQNIGAYGVELKDVFHSLNALEIASSEMHIFDAESCKFGYRESVFKRELKNQYVITSVVFKLNKEAKIKTDYGVINDQLKEFGKENPTPADVSRAVIAIRQSKLPEPKEIGNAGSFFKNPIVTIDILMEILQAHPTAPSYPVDGEQVKIPAGWLIEQAGWKGKTIDGKYGVHKNQALVLVNYSNATGNEIYELSTSIINDVNEKFGVKLEREVNIY